MSKHKTAKQRRNRKRNEAARKRKAKRLEKVRAAE